MTVTSETSSGRVGNLTPLQQEKLREFWEMLIQSWTARISSPDGGAKAPAAPNDTAKSTWRRFSLTRSQTQPAEEEMPEIPSKFLSTLQSLDASPSETKAIQSLLSKLHGDELRLAYLTALKQEHPDTLLLRFLRAEKWNTPKAWIKFVAALNWRVNVYNVDAEILRKGEEYALEQSRKAEDSVEKENGKSFVVQLQTGKGHFHGFDKWGRPICIIRVRCHNPQSQSGKGLNDFIIHSIETARLMLSPLADSITVVFDLTSFSLSNWDFPPVKFIIDNFQENYPESLGALIFYNAPWIFSGLWKIIHGILDPVVASKVHFMSGAEGLEPLIPQEHILKELGGKEDWEYEYIEPKPHENDRLHDTAKRNTILAERNKLGDDLFGVTTEWISNPEADSLKSRRDDAIKKLSDNYWELDPYVRSRTILDRTGVIQGGGKTNFYASAESEAQA